MKPLYNTSIQIFISPLSIAYLQKGSIGIFKGICILHDILISVAFACLLEEIFLSFLEYKNFKIIEASLGLIRGLGP